jgi:hypothetical protein
MFDNLTLTPEIVLYLIGVFLAVVFEYFPKLHERYNSLPDDTQRFIMLAAVAVVVFGGYGLSCAGLLSLFACTFAGFWKALMLFVATLVSNQGLHRALPRNGTVLTTLGTIRKLFAKADTNANA